ncbi:hypothetical protein K402DRAFT_392846 [Aulographum hederae CBS 113979]|uniref:Uncharacterized protein n=1 Tax=Aulographum hederae CBS 113979 TaxID=1176131 RepID=A0A6G1H3F4_9PEZI|nr:hypothetical protein K402DRAFT_392846 [Aulographum hederae CBS 113979]
MGRFSIRYQKLMRNGNPVNNKVSRSDALHSIFISMWCRMPSQKNENGRLYVEADHVLKARDHSSM